MFFQQILDPRTKGFLPDDKEDLGTEEAEEEDQEGQKLLQEEEDRAQTAAEKYERVCRSMKNIFGYKKSNSRQSENIPPRVSPVSLEEMREKKMMAIL